MLDYESEGSNAFDLFMCTVTTRFLMKELFAEILNISISAGILIIVCVLVRLIFRKMPKFVRCLMWLLVAVRLAIPFNIESPISMQPAREYVTITYEEDITVSSYTVSEAGSDEDKISLDIYANEAPKTNDSSNIKEGNIRKNIDIMYVMSVIWIIGVSAVIVYAVIAYIRLRKLVDDAVLLKDNIYQSEKVGTAFVLGIISPKIYVPYGLNANELFITVNHEKAHLARRDHFVKPFGFIITAVYWFNPLVWLAYILLCKDIELACDEKVIKKIGYDKKKEYTQTLLNLSIPRKYISACPVAFGEVGLNERIKNILNMKKGKKIIIVTAVAVCAVIAICFLTYPKTSKNNIEEASEVAAAEETSEIKAVEEETEVKAAEETTDFITEMNSEINEENSANATVIASSIDINDENSADATVISGNIEINDENSANDDKTSTDKYVYIVKTSDDRVIGETILVDGEEVNIVQAYNNEDFAKIFAQSIAAYEEDAFPDEEAVEAFSEVYASEFPGKTVYSLNSDNNENPMNTEIQYIFHDTGDNTEYIIVEVIPVKLESTEGIAFDDDQPTIAFPVIGSGAVTRGFSDDHKGSDISAKEGTAVVSLYDGEVIETGFDDKEGNYIIILNDKGGTVKYSHLQNESNVSEGDEVKLGTEIGKVGSTGQSTGPHVHIEITDENGQQIDPMSIIEIK